MTYFEDAISELKTIILATWGDVPSGNIYTTLQALERNIINSNVDGTLTGPIVVIEYGSEIPASYSIDRQSYFIPVTVSRVEKQNTGVNISGNTSVSQATLSDKATALKLAIRNKAISATPFSNFTLEDDGEVNSGASNGVNAVLKVDSKTSLIGVQLTYNPGFHVTPFS